MFTTGQKARMRSSFAVGGAHQKLAGSTAATATPISSLPVKEEVLIQSTKQVPVLYPNPASTTVIMDLKSADKLVGEWVVFYNQLGQQVFQYKLAQTSNRIDISRLKDGVYFLKIGNNGGTIKMVKSTSGSLYL